MALTVLGGFRFLGSGPSVGDDGLGWLRGDGFGMQFRAGDYSIMGPKT